MQLWIVGDTCDYAGEGEAGRGEGEDAGRGRPEEGSWCRDAGYECTGEGIAVGGRGADLVCCRWFAIWIACQRAPDRLDQDGEMRCNTPSVISNPASWNNHLRF